MKKATANATPLARKGWKVSGNTAPDQTPVCFGATNTPPETVPTTSEGDECCSN